MSDCAICGQPLVYVVGMPSECVAMCTCCGCRYYSESWAEGAADDEETQSNIKSILAFRARLKRKRPQIAASKTPPRRQSTTPHLPNEKLSCRLSGG